MKCPACATTDLMMSERSGIEIDYCPQCRGVWLDRGELDKIIARSLPAAGAGQSRQANSAAFQNNNWGNTQRRHDHHEHGHSHHGKKSFWQELFD